MTSRGIFRRQKEMPETEEEMDVLTVNFGSKERDEDSDRQEENAHEPSLSLNAESDDAPYDGTEEEHYESEAYEEEISSRKVGFLGRMARTLGLKKEEETAFEKDPRESEMTFVADPSPRSKAANEEDALEIPAYLRRKAGQ